MKMRLNCVAGTIAAMLMVWTVSDVSVKADEVIKPSPMTKLTQNLNPANWKMPQWKMPDFKTLLPSQDEEARIRKKKDGFVGEISTTATNSWNKTKKMLDPQKLNPARMFPASTRTPSKPSKPEKSGFFQSLFAQPEPEKDVSTVTDFLRQSRPSP